MVQPEQGVGRERRGGLHEEQSDEGQNEYAETDTSHPAPVETTVQSGDRIDGPVRRKRSKPQECPDRTSDDVGYISGVLAKDHRGG